MLVYETEFYQVHLIKTEYQTVNRLTGVVEDTTIKLPQALNMADALSGALTAFFREGKGNFNPDIQKGFEHDDSSDTNN